jgi:hypothetical protein
MRHEHVVAFLAMMGSYIDRTFVDPSEWRRVGGHVSSSSPRHCSPTDWSSTRTRRTMPHASSTKSMGSELSISGSLPGARNIPEGALDPGKDRGEVRRAKDDRQLPMEDHNTRTIIFGRDVTQARKLAEAIAQEAFPQRGVLPGVVRHAAVAVEVGREYHDDSWRRAARRVWPSTKKKRGECRRVAWRLTRGIPSSMSTTRPWAPQGVVDDLLNVHDDGEDERQVGKLTGPELSDEVRFDGRRDRDGAGRHGEVASSSRFVGRFDAIPTTRRTSPRGSAVSAGA